MSPTLKLRHFAEVTLGRMRSRDGDEDPTALPYLRAANVSDGHMRLQDVKRMAFTSAERLRYRIQAGDVLLTEASGSRAQVGQVALASSEVDGYMFQNTLLRLRPRTGLDGRYLFWWARHAYGSGLFAEAAQGLGIWHLGADRLGALELPVPPLEVQRRAADFLDDQVALIDRAIHLRQEQAEVADLRRRALLSQAFGAGDLLDIVEGGGRSTHGWATRKLGPLLRSTISGGTPSTNDSSMWDDEEGTPWVAIGDMVEGGHVITTSRALSAQGLADRNLRPAAPGAVLFAMYASVGKTSVLAVPAVWNQAIIGLVPGESLLPDFLLAWLQLCRPVLPAIARSSTQDNLNAEQVKALHLPLPGQVEQRALGQQIHEYDESARHLKAAGLRQVRLLQERKQALITAAVTGEFDVTTATARAV